VPGPHLAYGFLTTAPNEIVEPIHPAAMPVILTTDEVRCLDAFLPAASSLETMRADGGACAELLVVPRNGLAAVPLSLIPTVRSTIMDREHVKGAADKAKGAIKEGAGKLTGDKEMETEGKFDKAKGSAHNVAGDVKDAARKAADAMKSKQEE
jgi:uncharacterized protein YjbJ (UPF0337 family)